jgi:hypothetical protein
MVVPITPTAWRRDVISLGELVFSATIVSSFGIVIEAHVDRLAAPSTPVRDHMHSRQQGGKRLLVCHKTAKIHKIDNLTMDTLSAN